MVWFESRDWLLMGLAAAAGTMAMLWVLAEAYARERKVHELKIRVFELRRAYARRLAEINARDSGGTIGSGEAAPAGPVSAPPDAPGASR